MGNSVPFRDVVAYAIGGGWGSENPTGDGVPVSIIRGTDFARLQAGNAQGLPRRYEGKAKAEKRTLRPDDVVLEISGGSPTSGQSTGRTLLVKESMLADLGGRVIPASFCRLVRFDGAKVDPCYAYYCLQDMYVSGRAGDYEHRSTGISNFQFEYFLDHEMIRIVPLGEQRAIGHLLRTFDDKIEINRRMNQTLVEMLRTLFRSWFVDFDPVRAKANGHDPRVPKPVADLLPGDFVNSDLGEIPAGWTVRGLDEVARFLNGLALQKYPPEEGRSLPVIKIAQLRAGNTTGADAASADLPPDYIVEDGDVLFSWSGSLECVVWAGGPGALNQHLFKVTSTEFPKWLYYLWIHQHLGDFRQIAAGKATTMGHIQRHHLSDAKVAVPPPDVVQAVDGLMSSFVDGIWRRSVQSRTLAAVRNALLPKLISGELRLPHAERMLETVPA